MHYAPAQWFSIIVLAICAVVQPLSAQEEDKTLSPYFEVNGKSAEQFPLKSTKTDVHIVGVIADVVVVQYYVNTGDVPIEANYVFPASTRAAVYSMTMRVGDRVIKAAVQERERAQATYDKARSEGKRALLLEQQRPNVFQMFVANIMPGDTVAVELRYTELIIPAESVYRFVYPTVVGPRYRSGAENNTRNELSSSPWASTTHLEAGMLPTATFSLSVHIATGVALQDVYSTTHKFSISRPTPSEADLILEASEERGFNRDVVISYLMAGNTIADGLLLYKEGEEQYFLYMAQPPKRITPQSIPPREYIFIVDVSGSMHGFPLEVSQKLIGDVLDKLSPTDKFNIVYFAGSADALSEKSLPATRENIKKAKIGLMSYVGGGGTELLSALRHVVELPRAEGYSRTVVVATDGYITVEAEVFDFIRKKLNTCNVVAFGIGSGVNRYLIEGIARAGRGEAFVAMNKAEAESTAQRLRTYISSPVLAGINLNFKDFDAYDVVPAQCPDMFVERPVVVVGKWRGKAIGSVVLKAASARGVYMLTQNIADVQPDDRNSALKYLWARDKIAELGDYGSVGRDTKREITELGLRYNLLTAFTSFVAVDSLVANTSGSDKSISQPLPLPQGVSALSVSNRFHNYDYGGGSELSDPLCPISKPPIMFYGVLLAPTVTSVLGSANASAFSAFRTGAINSQTQMGFAAGLQVQRALEDVRPYSFLIFNASFVLLPGRLYADADVPVEIGNAASQSVHAQYKNELSMSMFALDVWYSYTLGLTRFSVFAGPSVGLVLSATEQPSVVVDDSESARFVSTPQALQQGLVFSKDLRTVSYAERDIDNIRRLRFSLSAGLAYSITMNKVALRPYVLYSFPLDVMSSVINWKISHLQMGLQIHML